MSLPAVQATGGTVTGEVGKARGSCVDGLDRFKQIFEDANGLNYETDYTYNTLDVPDLGNTKRGEYLWYLAYKAFLLQQSVATQPSHQS